MQASAPWPSWDASLLATAPLLEVDADLEEKEAEEKVGAVERQQRQHRHPLRVVDAAVKVLSQNHLLANLDAARVGGGRRGRVGHVVVALI